MKSRLTRYAIRREWDQTWYWGVLAEGPLWTRDPAAAKVWPTMTEAQIAALDLHMDGLTVQPVEVEGR